MQDDAQGASYVSGALTNMVDAGVSVAIAYPLCSMDEGNKTGGKGWGLFDGETSPGKALWRPLTFTYRQFGQLLQATPLKLPVTTLPIEGGFTVLAGKANITPHVARGGNSRIGLHASNATDVGTRHQASAGQLALMKLLVTTMSSNFTTVSVAVANFPAKMVSYTVMLTNATTAATADGPVLACSGSARANAAGVIQLQFDARPPAVAYLTIEASEVDPPSVQSSGISPGRL
jgi:hypothetical protein